MAKKKSALTGKLQQALKSHATDETNYGVDLSDPPPGINNGIAQLTSASIGEYKTGKYQGEQFCRLAGTIISPKRHTYLPKVFVAGKIQVGPPTTVTAEGLFTSIMIPLCDTVNGKGETTDLDEHVAAMLNELRKLGADTSEIGDDEDVKALLEALVDEGPYFKFGTSSSDPNKDYPEPRVWQNWYGNKGLENYTPEDAEDEVEEESVDEAEEAEQTDEAEVEMTLEDFAAAADSGDEDAAREVASRAEGCGVDYNAYDTWAEVAVAIEGGGSGFGEEDDADDSSEEEEAEEEEGEEEVDFASLGELADSGDDDAIEQLTTLADEAGLDTNDFPDSWASLAEALNETIEEASEEEEGEEYVPEKGDVVLYRPKGAKKPKECEVLTVNNSNSTSTLKNMDDSKKYPNVAWSDFEE